MLLTLVTIVTPSLLQSQGRACHSQGGGAPRPLLDYKGWPSTPCKLPLATAVGQAFNGTGWGPNLLDIQSGVASKLCVLRCGRRTRRSVPWRWGCANAQIRTSGPTSSDLSRPTPQEHTRRPSIHTMHRIHTASHGCALAGTIY